MQYWRKVVDKEAATISHTDHPTPFTAHAPTEARLATNYTLALTWMNASHPSTSMGPTMHFSDTRCCHLCPSVTNKTIPSIKFSAVTLDIRFVCWHTS
jgi:hypothetical protein